MDRPTVHMLKHLRAVLKAEVEGLHYLEERYATETVSSGKLRAIRYYLEQAIKETERGCGTPIITTCGTTLRER